MRYIVKIIPEDKIIADDGEIFLINSDNKTAIITLINDSSQKIKTSFEYPPVPIRVFDYAAVTDDYDGAEDSCTRCQIGYGKTKNEAIIDLIEQIEE